MSDNFDLDKLLQDVINYFAPNKAKTELKIKEPSSQINSSFGEKVLSIAQSDLGVHEDLGKNDGKRIREYFKYFNMGAGQNWCAAAVSAWMKEAGGGPISGAVGARAVGSQFASINKWVPKNKITEQCMSLGNIVIFSRGGPGSWEGHIGVIESSNGQGFTSIEGNSGPKSDSVVRNSHSINDSNLLGIGILSDYEPKATSLVKIEKLADNFYQNAFNLSRH